MTAVIKKSGTGAAQARCVSPLKPCLSHFAARHQFLKLRLQHAVKASEAAVQDAVTAELLQWMQHNGCAIQGVALQYEESNGQLSRELRAAKDLAPGELLISVPLHCTLHYINQSALQEQPETSVCSSSSSSSSIDVTASREALWQLQELVPKASDTGRGAWQFKVALEVLYQFFQGPSSPLAAYIRSLPGVCPGVAGPQVAMLFPEQDLQELQYQPLINDAASQVYWWKQYSSEVLGKLEGSRQEDAFGGHHVTAEQLGWALSIAMSRAFGFKQLNGWALVPLVDMANHSLVSNAEIRYLDGTVRMVANTQVPAGAPILLKYGSHDNANLLLSYGFVLPVNPADRYSFALDMDLLLAAIFQFAGGDVPPTGHPTDGLKQWQRTALHRLGLLSDKRSSSSSSSNKHPAVQQQPAAAVEASTAVDSTESAASIGEPGSRGGPAAANNSSSSSSSSSSSTVASPAAAADPIGDPAAPEPAAAAAAADAEQPVLVWLGGDPPVSPELLAAVRVALAADRALIKGRTLQQLGDWQRPLSREHEALVLKGLIGLCTVMYKSFPTSIQTDKALLAAGSQQQQQPPPPGVTGDSSSTEAGPLTASSSSRSLQGNARHNSATTVRPPALCGLMDNKSEAALAAERLKIAVRFRLALKMRLEASAKLLLLRLKEL